MTNSGNVLLIDSYDSFTFNLKTLIADVTGANVVTIHNDGLSSQELVTNVLPYFDAVFVGPGPGSPDNPSDVGVLPSLWTLKDDEVLPVFGVCLGFQSMVLGFGGQVKRLKEVQHGQPGLISHSKSSLFEGITDDFESIRYHSLHGVLKGSADIEPLAWTKDDHEDVLMAGKHATKPFYGVQYHPESICSDKGAEVIANFWGLATKYNTTSRTVRVDPKKVSDIEETYSIRPPPFKRVNNSSENEPSGVIEFKSVDIPKSDLSYAKVAVQVCDFVKTLGYDFTLLNSASEPGRWSIAGLLEPGVTEMITHYRTYQPDVVFRRKYKSDVEESEKLCEEGVYEYLAKYMMPKLQKFRKSQGPPHASFVGGLVGYLSYEMNDIPHTFESMERLYADVSLVNIEKTILIDQHTGKLYTVSICEDGEEFVTNLADKLTDFFAHPPAPEVVPQTCQDYFSEKTEFEFPDREEYIANIEKCKEFLRSGDSYELCLTAQTKIHMPDELDSWKLYKILLNRNPSPYSCYLDLLDSTLVGSSPERFMSWNREGTCEFRPIKGTVRKGPSMTYEKANAILNTNKERGENLMIVDLIRHDLNQIVNNVRVSKLMTVEEYHTVYQLVSVIQGELPNNYLGIDLLAHSLPPGSMTGAPKIRSVEILRDLESHSQRGIYSGVAGYWSVTDSADWSVVIRSAFHYKNEDKKLWRIGAGGAITILSNAEDEWDEMQTKLESALQAFV